MTIKDKPIFDFVSALIVIQENSFLYHMLAKKIGEDKLPFEGDKMAEFEHIEVVEIIYEKVIVRTNQLFERYQCILAVELQNAKSKNEQL